MMEYWRGLLEDRVYDEREAEEEMDRAQHINSRLNLVPQCFDNGYDGIARGHLREAWNGIMELHDPSLKEYFMLRINGIKGPEGYEKTGTGPEKEFERKYSEAEGF